MADDKKKDVKPKEDGKTPAEGLVKPYDKPVDGEEKGDDKGVKKDAKGKKGDDKDDAKGEKKDAKGKKGDDKDDAKGEKKGEKKGKKGDDKDEKKGKKGDDKDEKKYDPNDGAVPGTEVDPKTGRAKDVKRAAAVSGGHGDEAGGKGKKELHRHQDDVIPHPLPHEEQLAVPVVDGTTVAGGGVPGQPTEPTIPGQDQQVPSQPKSANPLAGAGLAPAQPTVDPGTQGGAVNDPRKGAVKHSPGESGTGKLPIA